MAAGSLLMLLDDIASVLDDVALMTRVAAKKTAGVLGDDLALNAQQVAGVAPERELPVVRAVALGSLRNKLILVPAALLISALVPQAIVPLLMLGGAYLCFEGAEKLLHRITHPRAALAAEHAAHLRALADTRIDLVAREREKIKGAVRTDFILSAEIIVISLGTLDGVPFAQQVLVLSGIALLMTVGVYGLVAAIVKLDDFGLHLHRSTRAAPRLLGRALLGTAPRLMKALAVIGTVAMFMVGGGILVHGLPLVHHGLQALVEPVAAWPAVGGTAALILPAVLDGLFGVLSGALMALAGLGITRLRAARPGAA